MMYRTGCQAFVLLAKLSVGLCNMNLAVAYKIVPWTKVPAIFAFGDSLVDSRTNNFINGAITRANYLPYGETYFHKGTGRFTNDFIASFLGLPFTPPFMKPGATFLQGVNFGSGGSGVLSTTGLGDGVNPLTTQVAQFRQVVTNLTADLGEAAATNKISNSLFFFVVGSNDLSAYFNNSTLQHTFNSTQFVSLVLSELEAHTQYVYSYGARKVVFFGIGPLGCSPRAMAAANGTNGICLDAPNRLSQAYDGVLLELVVSLNSKLPDLHAVMANPFDIIEGLVKNGTAHDFREGSSACCGSGPFNGAVRCGPLGTTNLCEDVGNFVFWDTLHPTQRLHHHRMAELMWDGDSSFIQPLNLKTLVGV